MKHRIGLLVWSLITAGGGWYAISINRSNPNASPFIFMVIVGWLAMVLNFIPVAFMLDDKSKNGGAKCLK